MEKIRIKDAINNRAKDKAIGGQAVMEGVMMRGEKSYAMAVRKPDGDIETVARPYAPLSDKYPVLKLPLVRGVAMFISSMALGFKIMTASAEIAAQGIEDEEPQSRFEKFLVDKLGDKLADYLVYFSVFLAIVMSVALFIFLPALAARAALVFIKETWMLSLVEGAVKLAIFVAYLVLISRSKDIRRVFEYHGAEHKTINCYEHDELLTVENVRRHSRLHKRCGTSFLLIVMLIGIAVFLFVRSDSLPVRFGLRLLLLPFVAGLSYEVIKWAGASNSAVVGAISWPGLFMQKLTTSEPDDSQIETAITALREVLRTEPGTKEPPDK
ncbi:MAG: DUF1385 domain-containing protein [Clostridiales bacterium]|jgi:uncharacterized protein YqhQ|nr:DUF1385 domain-containing protein [Clostridiales bacterium]